MAGSLHTRLDDDGSGMTTARLAARQRRARTLSKTNDTVRKYMASWKSRGETPPKCSFASAVRSRLGIGANKGIEQGKAVNHTGCSHVFGISMTFMELIRG